MALVSIMKEKAKENLSKLIEKYEKELSFDRIKDYKEEATKISFIQPFLKDVLGWDVNNHDEVSPEEKVSRGRVDYGLKVNGEIKIFVEAKSLGADLNKYIEKAVWYGYNRKGVPFVLLTDFEELKLFDVWVKPDPRNPLKGLTIDLQWNQYLQQFEKLWLLSRESVIQGQLDQLLRIKPKERLSVDKAILDDLKRWREILAKDIFKNNPELFHSGSKESDADYLKAITQRIIDRIIFMRSCEDRGLVQRRFLRELFEERAETVGTNTMIFLKEEFKHYNIIFNSDLFRLQDRGEEKLAIDFRIMYEIVSETYKPYMFDAIPIEVLGNIYEQYLGYTLRLTDHQIKYELKPEVRKAAGVYYTPEYVADFIVKNTVGKLLQESPLKKIKRLRILDPACGSGSFLIRAYEEMLNYYRDQKKSEPKLKEKQKELKLNHKEAEPHLTIHEKSEILQKHIFGVDIDDQAVGVTKLSLMLKMLEGESGIIPGRAILPMLDKNIKCGNSLVYGNTLELKKYFGDELYDIKESNILDERGFDVIIGNPPWVFTRDVNFGDNFKKFYHDKYFSDLTSIQEGKTRQSGKINLYAIFLLRGIRLLDNKGMFGFILPNNILRVTVYDIIRRYILDNCCVKQIVDLKSGVFENVTASTIILILEKNHKNNKNEVQIINNQSSDKIDLSQISSVRQASFLKNISYSFNIFVSNHDEVIFKKMRSKSTNLGNLVHVYNGIATKKNKEGVHDSPVNGRCKPLLVGKDIHRYYFDFNNRYIEYDRKRLLRPREEFIFLTDEKLVMQRIGGILITAYDDQKYYTFNSVNNLIAEENCPYSLKFILSVLNSKLMRFYYISNFTNRSNLTVNISKTYLDKLPFPVIDLSRPTERKIHDQLVALVSIMLHLLIRA